MITLKAPPITTAQRKELKIHKHNLEEVIRDIESDSQKVTDLRKKEGSLEKEAASLHHDAAQFHRDAEINFTATVKQIERVHEAIREAESLAHDDKQVNFPIIDQAQELVSKVCQASYNELLDQIAALLSPYYRSFNDARYVARSAHVVNDLVIRLLTHQISGGDSIERIFEGAKETLRKIDALLTGGKIYSYEGSDKAEKTAIAA
jgi:septal ring factor EnvC (AmiA/AmiB activator)